MLVEEREREIRQIVQSISDLNEIFRDLGSMIVEQVCVSKVLLCYLHHLKLPCMEAPSLAIDVHRATGVFFYRGEYNATLCNDTLS